jgi:hypothetical protein
MRTRGPARPALLIDTINETINAGVRAIDPMVVVRRIATMLFAE